MAVTSAGDASGFHVLAAEQSSGYQWRTVATLSEPGMDTNQWVGNVCVTGSGKSIVAVYAPRHFTNRPHLFSRGAFAAIIDVDTGEVTKLKQQTSLAYYNPGCGSGDQAVLTQGTIEGRASTGLLRIDTAKKAMAERVITAGQVTSAVAAGTKVFAAKGNQLVEVSASGKIKRLATADSVPFDLRPTADGGVAFAEQHGARVTVRHYRAGSTRTLATGTLGKLSVRSGDNGKVFLLGEAEQVGSLPHEVSILPAPPHAEVSSDGGLLVESAASRSLRAGRLGDPKDTAISGPSADKSGESSVDVTARVVATGAEVAFEVSPQARVSPQADTGRAVNPRLAVARPAPEGASVAASTGGTVDTGYTCAVPRNDPTIQVYQPHWRQVEWAVDQLVFKDRLNITRGTATTSWKGSGLAPWNPQDMFPAPDLIGGGRIPVSIMLGVLAQESNLWQAQRNVLEGETGNPLIGNYYGLKLYDTNPSNDWEVDFSEADCGYGISQQTDHMRKAGHARPGETLWPPDKQKAVALDYVTNIAAGMQTLASKWNEILQDTGGQAKINNGDPSKIENWYFAVWAYNSGWHPKSAKDGNDSNGNPNNGAWGVGWANNPTNPDWHAGRYPFLDGNNYADASHPQWWPYQEKVLGWSAWPIAKTYWDATQEKWADQAGYNAPWWISDSLRREIVPTLGAAGGWAVDINAFCYIAPAGSGAEDNDCFPGTSSGSTVTNGTCMRSDFKCWWHMPKAWKSDCAATCGNEAYIRYDNTWAAKERDEPTDHWTPCLTSGLPAGALVVDDVLKSVPAIRGGCDNSGWTNNGTLTFEFGQDAAGRVPARADFQQLGNGFGGHEWFGYTRNLANNGQVMEVKGTWALDSSNPIHGWARVLVHVPKRRAESHQAPYTIDLGNGTTHTRYLSVGREENSWQSLGAFQFDGVPKVALSTLNFDGNGTFPIAWDAIAFQKLPGKPKHFVVAMGDSFSSGEGAGDYYRETDNNYLKVGWNACRRSRNAWARKTVLPGETETVGALADRFDPRLDFAFLACSGAFAFRQFESKPSYWSDQYNWDTYVGNADGRYREVSQLEAGYLDENTTLVTMTFGGNDAGFAPALTDCALPVDCSDAAYKANRETDIDNAMSWVGPVLSGVATKVGNGTRAKKASIVLMGYPRLMTTADKGNSLCEAALYYFNVDEREMLDGLADYAATKQAALVTARASEGVSYANPIAKFDSHGICANAANGSWFVVPKQGTGQGGDFPTIPQCVWKNEAPRCVSRESVHPNTQGTTAYAEVLQSHLATINYTGW
ncbi:SGNH/GDSL hydrolase family protein [Streptosporangium sp. NPDC049644]|uniref:SGNH/GDSL hydrolase family protein n=1 Tax=Streptosporangium sp. NPDC049644 TaxID=3155507 RepID=UPI0034141C16